MWPQRTFQDGGDDGGQQAAGIDRDVEDGEEGASLLFLHTEKAEINMTGVGVVCMRHHIPGEAFRTLTPGLEPTHRPAVISYKTTGWNKTVIQKLLSKHR